ncbi:MAG: HAD-IIIC family phosphatase, partial [Acidobacteriaceae bacterium]|nr:HAD-IIIC family phosphatase [Acidobacteriaceae bacterium]
MSFRLAISATFTAEPIEPVLTFWGRKLELPIEVRFAAYNQVAQSLLDPAGEFAQNHQGVNVLLVRVEDLGQFEHFDAARMELNLCDLIGLVREAAQRLSVPLLFVLCPPSPGRARLAHDLACRAEAMLEGTPGVVSLTYEEIERLYPVAVPHNAEGERLGAIPYTDVYFSALGTAVIRIAHGLLTSPYKVIALDCDNTLWRGICGEDGPRGIVVDPHRRQLQQFMVEQREQGMLLALNSKNNERDVLETFEQNPDMPLQPHHFAARRLNWESKGPNLLDLASELSIGVDSVVFVDDNPKECAEVSESVPEALVLALPEHEENIPAFLRHVWAFDHVVVTEEDRHRNAYYTQAQEFGRELKRAASLEHFVGSLGLRITFEELRTETLPRASQLTQRTNQFNFTTIRRTEQDLRTLAERGWECRTVRVSDRFGDYGITGLLTVRASGEVLEIDTFLLSCRVLGRGVEHRVMARLGTEALERGLTAVSARLETTKRNEPAREFLH